MIGLAAPAFQTSRAAARPGIRVCSIEQRLAGRSMCDCGTPLGDDAPGDAATVSCVSRSRSWSVC